MTPLALAIVRDSLQPEEERNFNRNGCRWDIAALLLKAQMFECSAVASLIEVLMPKIACVRKQDDAVTGMRETRYAFLPAPVTWIEMGGAWIKPADRCAGSTEYVRQGALLIEHGDKLGADAVFAVQIKATRTFQTVGTARVPLQHAALDAAFFRWRQWSDVAFPPFHVDIVRALMTQLYPLLIMINSPGAIDRSLHEAHAGLRRDLRHSGEKGRADALRPWTELRYRVFTARAPKSAGGGGLTGKKALHFVKAFCRVRLGRLEDVTSHWRGDKTLGVVRKTYAPQPPAGAPQPPAGAPQPPDASV